MIAHVENNKQLLICIAFVCFSLQTKAQSFTASEVVDSYLKACELMKRDSTGYADYKKSREILENILPYANDDIKKYCCPLKLRLSRARVCMHARDEVLADNNIFFYFCLLILYSRNQENASISSPMESTSFAIAGFLAFMCSKVATASFICSSVNGVGIGF